MEKKAEKLFGLSKRKLPWLLVLFLIGVVLLTVSNFVPDDNYHTVSEVSSPETNTGASAPASSGGSDLIAEAEAAIETRLENILAKVDGVGDVSVTVSLKNGPEYVYAINEDINETKTEEKDSSGGSRVTVETTKGDQTVMAQPAGAGGQQPVVVKEIKPEIAGVLVAAEGARDVQVKEALSRAVTTLLGIPAHRVSVLPKEVQ